MTGKEQAGPRMTRTDGKHNIGYEKPSITPIVIQCPLAQVRDIVNRYDGNTSADSVGRFLKALYDAIE